MTDFVIMTDSDTEIPFEFVDKHNLPVFLMPYILNGKEILFDLGRDIDVPAFYKELSEGAESSTTTRSPTEIADFFRELVKDGKEVLYLCFSSALSAHFGLAQTAKKMILEETPNARIEIVDTLRISMGAGQLVMLAQGLKEEGKSLDEIKDWVEKNKLRSHAWFSVDDLNFLKKGGRLSGTAAALGTILNVKPILKLNSEGKIVSAEKVKGTKKVLAFFVDVIRENIEQPKDQTIYVLQANSMETAEKLKAQIEEAVSAKEVVIRNIGPIIGCHTGPGTLAVVFMGKEEK